MPDGYGRCVSAKTLHHHDAFILLMPVQRYNDSNHSGTMSDRYLLSREFNLELFEREVLHCTNVAELQNLAIKLRSQVHSQQLVYEQLLKDALQA